MSIEINWQEPPPSKRGPGGTDWAAVRSELQANPGKWALVLTDVSASSAVNARRLGLEATTRGTKKDDNGRTLCDIYVRWPVQDSA